MGQAVQHAAGGGTILCAASRTLHLSGRLLQAQQGWNGVWESDTAVWAQSCNLSGPEGWRAKTSVGCPNSTTSLPIASTPEPWPPRLHEAEHCGGAVRAGARQPLGSQGPQVRVLHAISCLWCWAPAARRATAIANLKHASLHQATCTMHGLPRTRTTQHAPPPIPAAPGPQQAARQLHRRVLLALLPQQLGLLNPPAGIRR